MTKREALRFTGLLSGLLVVFFWSAVFQGRVVYPFDFLEQFLPWSGDGAGVSGPQNSLLADQPLQFYPWLVFNAEHLRSGRLPLWNPHGAAGVPHLANHQSAVLFPPNVLFYLWPNPKTLVVIAAIKLYLAGLGAFLFFRRIAIDESAATLSAIAFTFCGFSVLWLNHPHTNVAVFLPLLFWLTERLLARRTPADALLLALAVGLQYLGGHLPTSVHVLAATAAYCLFKAWPGIWCPARDPTARRAALLFAAGIVVGTGLAAVQLVPTAEYVWHSTELRERLLTRTAPWSLTAFRGDLLVLLLFPRALGTPVRGDYWGDVFGLNFNETNGAYVGLLPLLAALYGLRRWRSQTEVAFFGALAAISAAIICDLPLVANLLHVLPPFSILTNYRLSLLLAFALCALCGLGLTHLGEAWRDGGNRRPGRWPLDLGALALCLAAGTWVGARAGLGLELGRRLLDLAQAHAVQTTSFTGRGSFFVPFARPEMERAVGTFVANLPGYLETWGCLFILSALGLSWIGRSRTRPPLVRVGVLAILVVDLFDFGMGYNPRVAGVPPVKNRTLITLLQRDPSRFRTLFLDDVLPANLAMYLRLDDVGCYDGLGIRRYTELSLLSTLEDRLENRIEYISPDHANLLDLLEVKYVLSRADLDGPGLKLLSDGEVKLYQNLRPLPRAWIAHDLQVLHGPEEVLRRVTEPAFGPRQQAILESDPGLKDGRALGGDVRVTRDSTDEVRLETVSLAAGILVLLDSYYPGWKATVDGRATRIYPAYLAFRAIALPAGAHEVASRYDPLSFKIGAWISLASLLCALGVVLVPRWARRTGAQ
jgi:hypothetical protein